MTVPNAAHLRAVPAGSIVQPYNLPKRLERDVVYWCCNSPDFWRGLGFLVEAEALSSPPAKLLVQRAKATYDQGGVVKNPALLLAALAGLRDRMKLDPAELDQVEDYLDAIEISPSPEDAVRDAVAPILQRRKQNELVHQLIHAHGQHKDVGKIVEGLREIPNIGRDTMAEGMTLDLSVFADIDKLRHIERLPLGVSELDAVTEGGLGRSQLCVVMGKSGDGKSMFLVNAACKAICSGLNVAVGTLELEEEPWTARVLANLTGVPTNHILKGDWQRAYDKLEELQKNQGFGSLKVRSFPPRATKWSEIRRWFEHAGNQMGGLDAFITDYADKILPDGRHDGTYGAMGEVYEEHRLWAVKWKCWAMTASQKKSGTQGHADIDDASDSAMKGRVTDMMLDLCALEEGTELSIRVLKNRHGPSRMDVGPLITDFARARVSKADIHTLPTPAVHVSSHGF